MPGGARVLPNGQNVAKAKPLFKGHYQPHIPADLGFYDLRLPEVREAQAELAREAGIEVLLLALLVRKRTPLAGAAFQ